MRGSKNERDPLAWYRYTGPLRTIDGQLPRGCPWNRHWAIGQGETFYPFGSPNASWENRLHCYIDYTIVVIQLNNEKWIARHAAGDILFDVTARQFDTRVAALRSAIAYVIRLARRRTRTLNSANRYATISPALAQDVISWAMSLLHLPAPTLYVKPIPVVVPPPAMGQLSMF